MIVKQCQFAGRDTNGEYIHVLQAGYDNANLTKLASVVASPPQLGVVQRFMKDLPRRNGKLYTLISALGAGEYWGSNSNADYFGEGPLLHVPPGWDQLPYNQQVVVGKKWAWGYPTFYNAHAFAHHQNKDPNRAFGSIEYVMWDPSMKRVLLIVAFDRARATRFGSTGVLDRVENGEYPSVSMGCFPAGTLVTMGDGARKPIEEVCVGDEVITHKGRKKKVTETHLRKYKGDLYSIKAEAHRTLRCTSEHPLLAVDRDEVRFKNGHGRWEWKQLTKDPFPVDWAHASCLRDQYLIEPVVRGYHDNNVTPRDRAFARILGYYLAEGHLLRNKEGELAGIELTTNKNDPIHEEIEGLCADLGTKNPPVPRPRSNSSEAVAISIFDRKLAKAMLQWAGVYSTEKRLSEHAFLWHPSLALEMLGAYANGDGCCYEGTIKFSSSSEGLAWQLVAMLPRLGMMPSVSCIRHKAGSGFSSRDTFEWVVRVGKQWAPVLAPYCQKLQPQEVFATKNSRKIYHGNIVTPIRNIEALYAELDVYNLEVEEDESFLAEGLAVHNCRVPYDICSYCADWSRITLNPRVDIAAHKQRPIRGLSTETSDYCTHLKNELNKIYPDGRKVMMMNMHPRFFDLSVVFIGADKTSFVLAKLAGQCPVQPGTPACKSCRHTDCVPSAHVAEVWDRSKTAGKEKVAFSGGLEDLEWEDPKTEGKINDYLKRKRMKVGRIKTSALSKDAEIIKQVQSNFRRNLPRLQREEPAMPREVQNLMSERMADALSTAGSMGIVAKPREFQRIYIRAIGRPGLADELDDKGLMFRTGAKPASDFGLSGSIIPKILKALLPLMEMRSALTPSIAKRTIIMIKCRPKPDLEDESGCARLDHPLMDKVSSAYSAYRRDLLHRSPELIKQAVFAHPEIHHALHGDSILEGGLVKSGADVMESVIGMLTSTYLNEAYLDEPVSEFVGSNCNLAGLEKAAGLAVLGGVA